MRTPSPETTRERGRPSSSTTSKPTTLKWSGAPSPGHDPVFNGTQGLSYLESPLPDEEQTDGLLATNAVQKLANFSERGVGAAGAGQPFFLAVGLHKPHLPHIVPKAYFDLYDVNNVSLPPNPRAPEGFQEEYWATDGTFELEMYNCNAGPEFNKEGYGFNHPIDDDYARSLRRGYFAATSFIDAQMGRVLDALEANGYLNNTIVVMWSDHGWHLGDTNSWAKMTNFESATRNALLWRVPGQTERSKGANERVVEMVDLFPTLIELTGVDPLPFCKGDEPPSVACLQGESYADEFIQDTPEAGKAYAFSQWPGAKDLSSMGYTVRSRDGFRYTEYVPYSKQDYNGTWAPASEPSKENLFDYTADYWETVDWSKSKARGRSPDPKHTAAIAKLKRVLRSQYAHN